MAVAAGVTCPLPASAPTLLYEGPVPSNAYGLLVDDERVYWIAGITDGTYQQHVLTIDKCGGAPRTLGETDILGLAIQNGYVYWANGGPLHRELGAGGTDQLLLTLPPIETFSLSGSNLLAWSPQGESQGALALWSIPLGGAASRALVARPQSAANRDIAVDATHAYFATAPTQGGEQIGRVALNGGAPEAVTELVYPSSGSTTVSSRIVLDEGYVYWSTSASQVIQVPKAGGPPVVLTEPPGAAQITADNAFVYVADITGVLSRVPKAGGAAQVLATPQLPSDVAVDARSIYWVESTSPDVAYRIMKLDLPSTR